VEVRDRGRFSPAPQDEPFYHYAIAGNAAYIVTDNVRDFPPLQHRKRPQIITPAEAVERLGRLPRYIGEISYTRPLAPW